MIRHRWEIHFLPIVNLDPEMPEVMELWTMHWRARLIACKKVAKEGCMH